MRYRGKRGKAPSWIRLCIGMGGFFLLLGAVGAMELEQIGLVAGICEAVGGLALIGIALLMERS